MRICFSWWAHCSAQERRYYIIQQVLREGRLAKRFEQVPAESWPWGRYPAGGKARSIDSSHACVCLYKLFINLAGDKIRLRLMIQFELGVVEESHLFGGTRARTLRFEACCDPSLRIPPKGVPSIMKVFTERIRRRHHTSFIEGISGRCDAWIPIMKGVGASWWR